MPIIAADEDSDLYGGGEMPVQDRRASPKQAEALAEDSETAILPKSLLLGKEINPGDSVILKVLDIGEDQLTVAYEMEDEEEEPESLPEEEVMAEDDGMDSMMMG